MKSIRLAQKALFQGAEYFKEIDELSTDLLQERSMMNEISESCKNLTSFYLCGDSALPWFIGFGSRMRKLSFSTGIREKDAVDIAMYCTNIRELKLTVEETAVIEGSNLWPSVGNTSESLSL